MYNPQTLKQCYFNNPPPHIYSVIVHQLKISQLEFQTDTLRKNYHVGRMCKRKEIKKNRINYVLLFETRRADFQFSKSSSLYED